MKSEAEVKQMLAYWKDKESKIELESLKPPIRLLIGVLEEVLGD